MFATRKGIVKKTEFAAYNTPLKAEGIIAIKLRDDDSSSACGSPATATTCSWSRASARRSASTATRCAPMGRDTSGVAGMKLRGDDEVIEVDIAADDADLSS